MNEHSEQRGAPETAHERETPTPIDMAADARHDDAASDVAEIGDGADPSQPDALGAGSVDESNQTADETDAPSSPEDDQIGDAAPPANTAGQSQPEDESTNSHPKDDSSDGSAHGEDADSQPRRVLLQAGTDEESLKALALCREKVTQLHLRMHPLAARWESDRHVIIFFRADDRIDFRKLVRELSRLLHARIELRQVGPREQGKLCGLVGKCGYPLCCQAFLGQFAQSTIKMAKTQELALNPMKISGVCGRLLCCLNYEQSMYLDAKSRLPRANKIVQTEFGPGRVVAVNVLKETVTVQFETMTKELRPDQVRLSEDQS
jgi:cell fate regulator YaaT (PSP1 superfamily)